MPDVIAPLPSSMQQSHAPADAPGVRCAPACECILRDERLQRLLDASLEFSAHTDQQALLAAIQQQACRLLEAEACVVFLVDRTQGDVVCAAGADAPAPAMPPESVAGTVFATGQPLVIPDAPADERYRPDIEAAGGGALRAILGVPLPSRSIPITIHGDDAVPAETIGVIEVLSTREAAFSRDSIAWLQTLAERAGTALQMARLHMSMSTTFMGLVGALAASIDAKDGEMQGHSARVTDYAMGIGQVLHLPWRQAAVLRLSALLHDVGKIGVPDDVLAKAGTLSEVERETVQRHTMIGYRILSSVPGLEEAARGILEHHERFDGGGYPTGLAGEQISSIARIITVADAFDAMRSGRAYRPPLSVAQALAQLRAHAGTQFDPEVVHALVVALGRGIVSDIAG